MLMNGKPMWCPPARTRSYAVPSAPVEDNAAEQAALLAEAAQLVRAGIRAGLVQPPPAPKQTDLGPSSVWAKCVECQGQFSRHIASVQPKCSSCRLEKKACKNCKELFQPSGYRQVTCGELCRGNLMRANMMYRRKPWIQAVCENCGTTFEKAPASPRKNCGQACGFASMARNSRKPKRK